MNLAPYPDYKDSGVPWLGRIPKHWTLERAKWLFRKVERPVRPEDEVVTCFRDGMVTLRKNRRLRGFTESIKEIGYQGIRKGDLVIHQMDAFAGAIGVSDSEGKGTPVYSVCEPQPGSNPYYYVHIVREMARSQWVAALAKGIRERSTDFRYATFGDQFVPIPGESEQAAMARFVAGQDTQFHRLIRTKRRLIELLNEQKQAIAHRAVTRGLNPDALLKPSGIPWLGDIPRHWELRRAKQVCSAIIDCKNRTPDMVYGGEFIVVRTTNIRNGQFNLKGSYPTDKRNYEVWTQRGAPKPGDVFFTREAPTGEACIVPDIPNLCMGQRMMYFRPNPSLLDAHFLLHSIYGPVVRTYIEHTSNGSTVGHLRLGQVSALPLLWCPVQEQKAIVSHIAAETAPLNAVIARAQREIELIREYRTRLVADVVTGQIDVRAAAAQLRAETEATELAVVPEDAELDSEEVEDAEA